MNDVPFAVSDKLIKRLISAAILITLTVGAITLGGWVFAAFLFLIFARSCFEWVRLAVPSPYRVLLTLAGVFYIGFSVWTMYLIQSGYPLALQILFLLMIWSSDTGAFVAGKTLRGPRMAITLSPNKTWAGFAGALIFPGLVASIYVFSLVGLEHIFWPLISGAAIGFIGQAGDLLMSAMKRHAGVKDTGRLIPGHGGLLDRIDALLLAAPVFLMIVRKLPYVFIS